MEISEIKKTIPFYVAGTLEEEERILVEKALQDSKELQEEVKFWQQAQLAVERLSLLYQEGHLTPEQIIASVEGRYDIGSDLYQEIERHLVLCSACRHDIDIIRSTYVSDSNKATNTFEDVLRSIQTIAKENQNFRRIKFIDVFAIAAVLVVIVVLFFTSLKKPDEESTAQENATNLVLHYTTSTRGETSRRIPIIGIDQRPMVVKMTIFVPHSEIDSLQYTANLSFSSGSDTTISSNLVPLEVDAIFDTVHVELSSSLFRLKDGEWNIKLTEILPPTKNILSPETYIYSFTVHTQ